MVSDAAALDRKSTYTLLKAAEQAGFNVILTDDDRSIAGMGEGATFSHLLEQFEPSKSRSKALPLPGHTPAKDHALLDMASSLDWRGVFETLEQDGRVVQYEDKEDAIAVIAKAWVSNDQNSPSLKQAVVGGTNAEVAALNAAIQHERVKIGGLEAGHTLNVVKPVWTETESKGLEAVYHADTLTLYKGDDIRFLRSERQYGIESGAVGRVVDVNSKKLIVEIDGQQIKLDPHKSNAFELGYASTLSRSKNHQSEHVHVLHSKMWDSRAAYSSLTLHTVNSTLYCDKDPRMADLAEQVAKRSNDTFTQNF
ncbi:MAG: hypothetical protein GY862_06585, partial [Gammaproteobacteria bacterium]|nr:hypothetical protein [Gammaproteobacteria bacterium]